MIEEAKLERAANGELLLRDEDGDTFQLDTFDDDGAYLHRDEGDTHRYSMDQIEDIFVFIDADGEEV